VAADRRNPELPVWLRQMRDEDLAFIKRFVLASGSLKEMARVYEVSYPTVRLRLDRLIAKIQVAEDQQIASPFERAVRGQMADGRIDAETFALLMRAHREEMEAAHDTGDSQ